LNNEKLVFTSNNAPLGMFARLPFRLGSIKWVYFLAILNSFQNNSFFQPV
jgi:hypothetical protein